MEQVTGKVSFSGKKCQLIQGGRKNAKRSRGAREGGSPKQRRAVGSEEAVQSWAREEVKPSGGKIQKAEKSGGGF